jgi:tryptophan synthase beta subunit
MLGIEAGGHGIRDGEHAARFQGGKLGVLQGTKTWLLADDDGQIQLTHSVSAGLDYAAVGPEHAYFSEQGRIDYDYATDAEALDAFSKLARWEGIIAALETPRHRRVLKTRQNARGQKSSSQSQAAGTRMSRRPRSSSSSHAQHDRIRPRTKRPMARNSASS